MVDLISLFLRIHVPTAKFKNAKNSVSNPHTFTSPISGDQLLPYSCKPLIMLSVVCACMMIGHVTAVYYVCSLIFKTLQKLMVFGDICEILSLLLSVIKGIGSRYKA